MPPAKAVTERARRLVFLLLQRFFAVVNLASCSTKLFGLNQVRRNESYRGGGLRGPFAPPSSFPALQPSGFYCTSPVPCAPKHRKWERSPSRAITPQYFPCIRLQLWVHGGMRGRGHIIKAALGNPTRLREQLRYQ